jgi:hypothetical protein
VANPIMFSAHGFTVGDRVVVNDLGQRTEVTVTEIRKDRITLTDAAGVSRHVSVNPQEAQPKL